MYLKGKVIKFLKVKNVILTIIGVLAVLECGFYIISEFTYYRDDPETALHAVSMADSILWVIIGAFMLCVMAFSRCQIKNATFFSGYFEGDLDGYIPYGDLAEITGKSVRMVRMQLRFYRWIYMKNFKLIKNENGGEVVELYSKRCLCECRNCGAHIEKRIYFTGVCPYCKSSDLFAKVLTDNKFYNITSDFATGSKRPDYYTARLLTAKKAIFTTLYILNATVAAIGLLMTLTEIPHYFDENYQREILFSTENHLFSYELIRADILDGIVFSSVVFIIFMPLAVTTFKKMRDAFAAGFYSNCFSRLQTPLTGVGYLPGYGIMTDGKHKLKKLRNAIRRGYLIHCTLEMHDGEPKIALAKRIVKDQCPYCGASIVGAVDENYVCQYCKNLIMGVVVKR